MFCTALLAATATVLTPLPTQAPAAETEKPYELMVGDPAPALMVEWVKGDPIDALRKDTTYVVEFWATWCGPCIKMMPHLSDLQRQYAERNVRFVGISIWEREPEKVRPFVDKMGDRMAYTVGMDLVVESTGQKPLGKTAAAWMDATGRESIPSSFIVKDGRVQWIGHPAKIDEVLKEVVEGTWDLPAAVKSYHDEVAPKAAEQKLSREIDSALRSGDWQKALETIDRGLAQLPRLEPSLGSYRLFCLARLGKKDQAEAYAEQLHQGTYRSNAQGLNFIARVLTDPQNQSVGFSSELAVRIAKKAYDLTGGREPIVLDTYASALEMDGDAAKAVEMLEKAVKLSVGTQLEPRLKQRLERLSAQRQG